MISHSRAELLLAESIDFDLAAGAAREVAEHLASCPACAAYAGALRHDAERVRQLPLRHAPPRVRAALEQAARRPARRGTRRVQLLLAAALLLGLLLGAALLIGSRLQRPVDLLAEWAAAPVGVGPAGAPQARMQVVAWGEDGFVAVGTSLLGAASWHSLDGGSWARGDDAGFPQGLSLVDVVAIGSGYVALGTLDGRATVCESETGRTWQCSQPTGLDGPGRAIASHAADVVVVGGRPEGGVGAWYRPGAGAWRQAAVPPSETAAFGAVAWTGREFLAVGWDVFSSPDGRSWALETLAERMAANDVTVGHDRLVVVGTAGGQPQAWAGAGLHDLAPSHALAASGSVFAVAFARDRFVAVGDGAAGAMAWTSPDGARWADAGVAGESGSRMVDVATDGKKVVAVGSRGTEAAAWRYEESR